MRSFSQQEDPRRTLLLLDDREDVLRALRRYLELDFDQILVARTPPEAVAQLQKHSPQYLLSDYWLGEEQSSTFTLIQQWRKAYPSLQRVGVMTGTKLSGETLPPGVDRVFSKPPKMAEVVAFFRESASPAG